MPKVLILGSSGLLGQFLAPQLRVLGCEVYEQGRQENSQIIFDPSCALDVKNFFGCTEWDVVVNLIAATNVDLCEINPQYAFAGNVKIIENLTSAIEPLKMRAPYLIHISSDQVYGDVGPHVESATDPLNVYGLSKFAGELLASRLDSVILRTNFFGRSSSARKKSFSDWIVQSLKEEVPITLFDDIYFNAVSMQSLCNMIHFLIEKKPRGVFNFGCHGGISKAQFGVALAKGLNLPITKIKIGSSAELKLKARRPKNMIMDISKLESTLNFCCSTMDQEISQTVMEYRNE